MGPSLECVRNRKSASKAGGGNLREERQEMSLEREGGDTPYSKALNRLCLLKAITRF